MMQILFSHSRMVTVTDDWFPCYPINQVELSLSLTHFSKCESWDDHYMAKISAWGMDDHGVEIEYIANNYQDAVHSYEKLSKLYRSVPNGVDMHWFFENGFSVA